MCTAVIHRQQILRTLVCASTFQKIRKYSRCKTNAQVNFCRTSDVFLEINRLRKRILKRQERFLLICETINGLNWHGDLFFDSHDCLTTDESYDKVTESLAIKISNLSTEHKYDHQYLTALCCVVHNKASALSLLLRDYETFRRFLKDYVSKLGISHLDTLNIEETDFELSESATENVYRWQPTAVTHLDNARNFSGEAACEIKSNVYIINGSFPQIEKCSGNARMQSIGCQAGESSLDIGFKENKSYVMPDEEGVGIFAR